MKLASTLALLLAWTAAALADPAPVSLPDLEGTPQQPLVVPKDQKGTVLIFISPYCPTANTFMPEINRLAEAHSQQYSFWLVHAGSGVKVTDAYQHTELFKVKAKTVLDAQNQLPKLFNAKVTPEVVVVGPDRKVLYQGRINDLYLGPTKKQRKATTKDLEDALGVIAAGQTPYPARTEAIGCKIEGLP